MNYRLLDPDWQPWWKQLLKVILGWNLATIVKALRLGPAMALQASIRSFDACDPLQSPSNQSASNAIVKMLLQIPEVKLIDLVNNNRAEIRLDVQRYEEGTLPIEHATALLALAVIENPPAVLEIGTFCGHTTKLLAQNLEESIIHTIDLPLDYAVGSNPVHALPKDDFHLITGRVVGRGYRNQLGAERIMQHWGDTAEWDFSLVKEVTFFFIDGSHTYDYVKNDSEKCFHLCRGKGVFVWHDCGPGHPGVLRLLTEWRREMGRNIVRIQGTTLAYLKTC